MTTCQRSFDRRLDALQAIFAFTAEVLSATHAALLPDIDFVLEELFTNVVKYGRGQAPVSIRIDTQDDGALVALDEPEAEPFDPTRAPAVDIDAPIERREAGGLGLHLIAKLVDDLSYTYDARRRQSRTTFRTRRDPPPDPA